MARKPKAPIALAEAPAPVTIELFGSYAEARASSEGLGPIATTLLSVPTIDGPAQERWAVERGVEIAALRKAIKDRQEKWLKPLRQLEAQIRDFDTVVIAPDLAARLGCDTHVRANDLLEICSKHLARLVGECRQRAAAAQAALLPVAVSETERAEALAALTPKVSGYVEVERWSWEVSDVAQIPHEYFVLDVARLDRECAALKGSLAVPGIKTKTESKGHFRS